VAQAPHARPDLLFYDAECALCRAAVGFVSWADREGSSFRFAPLGGATFRELLSDGERRSAPDSLLVRTHDRRVLSRSAAVLHALSRLGTPWRLGAAVAGLVPRVLRDAAYDAVAHVRRRIFPRSAGGRALDAAKRSGRLDP
jgi:predicted DCC family thiol-disulfide oxidoreductase YuxK